MELSRRDALAALAASGVAVGGGAVALGWADLGDGEDPAIGAHEVATLEALARVLYPAEVSNIPGFLESYFAHKLAERPDHAAAVAAAIAHLDDYCRDWWDDPFVDLDAATQAQVPGNMGLDVTDPDPEGAERERVRYYLVDELLFALYASPTGGELLGIENPPGHPGGLASYQRGPDGG